MRILPNQMTKAVPAREPLFSYQAVQQGGFFHARTGENDAPHGAGKGAIWPKTPLSTATEPVEGNATEPQGDGAKTEDWKAKYEDLLKQTRKHEDRAKANYAKAKAYDEAAKHAEEADGKLAELTEKAEKAEAELAAMKAEREREQAVAEVAKKASVPADVLKLMRGDTAEELRRPQAPSQPTSSPSTSTRRSPTAGHIPHRLSRRNPSAPSRTNAPA